MEFQSFLSQKLKELKLDVSVYLGYLMGILEDSVDEEEKREMVSDILASLIETDTEPLVDEIFNKYNEGRAQPKKIVNEQEVDIAELLKTQTQISLQNSSTHSNRQLTDEEKRIKQQILASYSQTSDKEDDEEEDDDDDDEDDDPNMGKNTNKSDVQKLAKEKREQARLESAQKKLKDKEDRAKQKSSREDKKKARQAATVKGERKR